MKALIARLLALFKSAASKARQLVRPSALGGPGPYKPPK